MSFSEKGPKPKFEETQLWETLEQIGDAEVIGRKKIARKLNVGEGSMRTILEILKKKGLIKSTPQGHSLTKAGKKELKKRRSSMVSLNAGNLTVGNVDIAVLVRNVASKVNYGIEQRDEAIKAGAKGATVLEYRDGKIQMPGLKIDIKKEVEKNIKKVFDLREGDVIVIGSGDKKIEAERGALAAAKDLKERKD